ncbi:MULTISPECIES: bifunctional diguanylate cyclase/phosphodiesterase [unclassified Francisella]|uniref:bifunctional diguanylate cyclase/phosphodiesterase n=1 Tax=unclassified Francisella TaxID=2610885 RepID=UPI002E3193A7|nr:MULTISPECIES: EAL domain-containing protein [unclassified Francisella]MED7820116.1 EAL domain-containing protein [Francisella sp. 19S2-4]MED7830936.1 EAL domain-containing protein [Francisella sp. 19S2-10]
MGIDIKPGSLLERLLSTLLDGVIIIDQKADIIYVNNSVEKLFGYATGEIIGKNVKVLMPQRYSSKHDKYINEYVKTGKKNIINSSRTVQGMKKDGTIFPIELAVSEMINNDEKIFVGTIKDLSEEYKSKQYVRVISKIQELHIKQTKSSKIFSYILRFLLDHTSSEYGFIGGIFDDSDGSKYLRTYAITDISWNKETKDLYKSKKIEGLEFRNLETLFGYTIRTGESLVTNDPLNHPEANGIPKGHPPLKSYAGIPIIGKNKKCIGMVGIANRDNGYDQNIIKELSKMIYVISMLIESNRDIAYIKDMANKDFLSGVYNRFYLTQFIERKIERYDEQNNLAKKDFYIIMIDCNGFKNINDKYGHGFGDYIIRELASRLKSVVKETDVVARLGGDEFIVVCNNINHEDDIKKIAQKISELKDIPYCYDNENLLVSMSIGVCKYNNGIGITKLLKYADLALYKSKNEKSNYILFDQSLKQESDRLDNLVNTIYSGFKEELFYFIYQPQVDLKTNKLIGFEALLRYSNSDFTTAEIIERIELLSLSEELNEYVFKRIIRDLDNLGLSGIRISINISPKVKNFRRHIQNLVHIVVSSSYIKNNTIEFELTESSFVEHIKKKDMEIISKMMKPNNINLAIDDFGVDHSSIKRLVEYDIDTLKIDKSFILGLSEKESNKNNIIVEAIIGVAKKLGIKVVAEGVEDKYLEKLVTDYECDIGQGYLYSQGLEIYQLKNFIAEYVS